MEADGRDGGQRAKMIEATSMGINREGVRVGTIWFVSIKREVHRGELYYFIMVWVYYLLCNGGRELQYDRCHYEVHCSGCHEVSILH